MEQSCSSSSSSRRKEQSGRYYYSYERLAAIGLGLLAVFSPLYMDRRHAEVEAEVEAAAAAMNPENWLPLMLAVLVVAIVLSRYLDESFSRFDPYWIHRVGGSSVGIIVILILLSLVLKCREGEGGSSVGIILILILLSLVFKCTSA